MTNPRPISARLTSVVKAPFACAASVSRRGQTMPCDKAAYMVRRDEEGEFYPVCRYHGQSEDTLTLAELLIQAVRL